MLEHLFYCRKEYYKVIKTLKGEKKNYLIKLFFQKCSNNILLLKRFKMI